MMEASAFTLSYQSYNDTTIKLCEDHRRVVAQLQFPSCWENNICARKKTRSRCEFKFFCSSCLYVMIDESVKYSRASCLEKEKNEQRAIRYL